MFLLKRAFLAILATAAIVAAALVAEDRPSAAVITVDAAHPGAAMSPNLFGIFFEDINFGADGGLYPERIKNRSFEFTEPLTAWRKLEPGDQGELDIRTERPLNQSNPHYLRVRAYQPGFAFSNSGYRNWRGERSRVSLFRLRPERRAKGDSRKH